MQNKSGKPHLKVDIESSIEEYATFGWWHIWTYLLVSLPVCFCGTFDISIIFIQEIPPNVCKTELSEVKSGWTFDQIRKATYFQWGLLCDKAIDVSNMQTSYVIGRIIGGFLSGLLADKFGRKTTVFPGLISASLVAIASPWIPNLQAYMVSRFLMGVLLSTGLNPLFVLTLEYFNENMRKFMAVYWNGYSTGYAVLAGIAYATRDWRLMHSIVAALNLACLPLLFWWLPESPRWCASKGRSEGARRFLKTLAAWNKKEIPQHILEAEFCTVNPFEPKKSRSLQVPEFYRVVFRHTRLLFRTSLLWFCWFVTSCVYYGITLLVTSFWGNVFINNAISGILEIPSNCLSYPLLLWARKKPLVISFFTSGVSCLLYGVLPSVNWVQLLVAFIGKFAITFCFNIIFPYTAELYYTQIRTSAVSCGAVGMSVAGVVAPYIVLIAYKDTSLTIVPMVIFGALGVGAGVCMLFLPESQNHPLPENLEEMLHYPPRREPLLKHKDSIKKNGSENNETVTAL